MFQRGLLVLFVSCAAVFACFGEQVQRVAISLRIPPLLLLSAANGVLVGSELFTTTPLRAPTGQEMVQGYIHLHDLLTLTVRSNVPWEVKVRVRNVEPLAVQLCVDPQLWVAVGKDSVRLALGTHGKYELHVGLILGLDHLPPFLLLAFQLAYARVVGH